jgi:hypothetical protein
MGEVGRENLLAAAQIGRYQNVTTTVQFSRRVLDALAFGWRHVVSLRFLT